MKFADFDKIYSRYLFGEQIREMLPKINFDDSLPLVKNLTYFNNFVITNTEKNNLDSLSSDKKFGAENFIIVKNLAINALIDVVIGNDQIVPLAAANKLINRSDSFNRPKLALKLHECMNEKDWLKCFFNNWTGFDGCSLYIQEVKEKLENIESEYVMKTILPQKQYVEWLNADDEICVYRGAFESFKDGLSWSTDVEVARKFANTYIDMKNKGLSYFRAMCQMPPSELKLLTDKFHEEVSIYSITVNKKDCIFLNDRGESEVFISKSHLYEIEDCLK